MQSNRVVRILVALIVALAVCAVAAWVYVGRRDYGVRKMPFDSAAWKASRAEESDDSVRLRMVDQLLMNNELEGMKREQVVELLGQSDRDPQQFDDFDLVYYLGRERSPLGFDDAWLVMRLDEQQMVTEAGLRTKPVYRPEIKSEVSAEERKALEEAAQKPEASSPTPVDPGDEDGF